jgi:Glycosyl hydrolases family 43/Ricin-type beta-trefoil lectin domain
MFRITEPAAWTAALLAALGLAAAGVRSPAAEAGAGIPSGQISVTGEVEVHDPTLYSDGDTYVVAATGGSIRTASSLGGEWTEVGDVPKADWTFEISPGALWAPQVVRVGDTFHYYYSQSSFGSQTSAIGLKTTQTPAVPSSYVDHGAPIIASGAAGEPGDPFEQNAIDPYVQQDLDGNWWIAWGSHWDGIMIQRLAADMVTPTGEMTQIASRGSERFPIQPGFTVPPNRVEGPALFQRGGYYYLMTGWDWCCRGDDSTYKISIGRSESIDGPYVDKNGVPLTEGGGSTILDSRFARPGVTPGGLWRAPGAPDVFVEDGTHYLVYHAYRPDSTLGIRPMDWHDGWPYFQEAGGGPYDLSDGAYYRVVNERGPTDPESVHNPVASDRCLTAVDDGGAPNVIQRTCEDEALEQIWRLEREADGFYRFRSMTGDRDRCLAMADGSGEPGTNVVVAPCLPAAELQQWYLDDTGHGFHRPVVRGANLALEVENVDGAVGTNVIGGFRRDGENRATHPRTGANCASGPAVCADANAWPPQQWQLVMTDLPAGDARLRVEGEPRVRRVGPRRERVAYRLRVDNLGAAPADAVRLCASAPARRVAILGESCVAGGPLPAGATRRRAVELRIKPAARGRLTRISLFARAANAEAQRTAVRLRVRR